MKVVHISSSDSGGAGIAARRLNNALNAAGIDSKLLCVHKSSHDKSVFQYKIPLFNKLLIRSHLPVGQNKYFRNIASFEKSYEAVSFPEALYDISNDEIVKQADIINLHWIGNILNFNRFFTNVKKPIVWTLHDMNPFLGIAHYMGDYNKNSQFHHIEEKVAAIKFKAISRHENVAIVNLCEWMKQYSYQSKMFSERYHTIIPNSIDTSKFKLRDKYACRAALGLSAEEKIVLFCAQSVVNNRKGFDLLMDAIPKLRNNCRLAIIGNTEGLKLPSHIKVQTFGEIRDELLMSIIYSTADVFVLPSREDNLPNTMLEALCCGTPVISFSNGGMRNIIKNFENGILVSNLTSDALANAINDYLDSHIIFNSENIAIEAASMFNPMKQAKQYISLYNQLLS